MPIGVARFYFKEGFPEVTAIKEKFNNLTGLHLRLMVPIHVNELTDDPKELIYKLNRDQQNSTLSEGENKQDGYKKFASIGSLEFYCYGFGRIDLDYVDKENKAFDLEFEASKWSCYFTESLMKTLLELGGRQDRNLDMDKERELEEYFPHEKRWKKLKKWNDYTDFERPTKI